MADKREAGVYLEQGHWWKRTATRLDVGQTVNPVNESHRSVTVIQLTSGLETGVFDRTTSGGLHHTTFLNPGEVASGFGTWRKPRRVTVVGPKR